MFEIYGKEENRSGSTVPRNKMHRKGKVDFTSGGIMMVVKGSSKSKDLKQKIVLTLASQKMFFSFTATVMSLNTISVQKQ